MSARTILKHLYKEGRMTDYQYERIDRCLIAKQGEWIKDNNPDKDGDYLCILGIGTVYFRRILHFTHDLYQIDNYAFHKYRYKKKTERSGWYDIDSDYGYFEVDDIHAWRELPEMPEEFKSDKERR